MMQVLLTRNWRKAEYTIGRGYIDGVFFINSLEDTDRGLDQRMPEAEIDRLKVYGRTAIPTGRYTVRMTWSPRFHRMMPEVENVKGFDGIRIHSGNTAEDSLGCILLGDNTRPGMVLNSRVACREFERRLDEAGGRCELVIQ